MKQINTTIRGRERIPGQSRRSNTHLVDVLARQPSLLGLDLGPCLGVGDLVLRGHVQDAVGVEGEANVDLRLARAGPLDSADDEAPELVVGVDVRPFALVNDNVNFLFEFRVLST